MNTSPLSEQAAYLWVKESALMKLYPHFLMVKYDGSIKDISRKHTIKSGLTSGYASKADSNISTQTSFMMTNDMKLFACNYLTGNLQLP